MPLEFAAPTDAMLEEDPRLGRLHPSLRATFVSLPGGHSILTPEQLDAIFGGDRRALRDMAKLVFQTPKHNNIV
jgi:hypothetical protein